MFFVCRHSTAALVIVLNRFATRKKSCMLPVLQKVFNFKAPRSILGEYANILGNVLYSQDTY